MAFKWSPWLTSATSVLTILAAGCGQPLSTVSHPARNQSNVERNIPLIASMQAKNYATGLVHDRRVDAIRRQSAGQAPDLSGLRQSLNRTSEFKFGQKSQKYSVSAATYGYNSTSQVVSGEPAFVDATTGYFVAANGDVYRYLSNTTSAPSYLFTIDEDENHDPLDPSETFPNSQMIVFPDANGHHVMYLCSAVGTFFIVDVTNQEVTDSYAMGGNDADVGYTAPPFIDFYGSSYPYQINIAAVTNLGTLFRFKVDCSTDEIIGTPDQVPLPKLAVNNNRKELYVTAPIFTNSIVSIGSRKKWKANDTGQFDQGGFYSYDLSSLDNVPPVVPSTPTINKSLTKPVTVDPTIEFNGWDPGLAIFPNGNHLLMVDLVNSGSSPAESPDLLVEPDDPATGTADILNVDPGATLSKGILARPVIFDYNRITIVNSNAFWKLDYSSPTYDDFSTDAWDERWQHFSDPTLVPYSKTLYGLTSTQDNDGKYVYNKSYMTGIYGTDLALALDSQGNINNSTGTALNVFTVKTSLPAEPAELSLLDSIDLYDTTSATQVGSKFISYAYGTSPERLLFVTHSNSDEMTPSYAVWSGHL